MPPSASYRPATRVLALESGVFHDEATAAPFPALTLRFRNQRWAERIGLGQLDDGEWLDAFARFAPLPDNLAKPLALRYHGHQFRNYNPAIGDGRGFVYAQLYDSDDRLLDLATKGSGKTLWSRDGDGRLTLKGGVREVLATEMLEALGVYTSKTFSLIETGEQLVRYDEPSPTRSSVLVRLGHSHIRFGTFQRQAYHRQHSALAALVEFCMAHYAPELCCAGGAAVPMFLQLVTERSARLCASWMAAGFVHGVLNTDNMNVTGESFDYGPYRFLPTLDPKFTAAYFDHSGLYAYGRQPASVYWNLHQLAGALEPLSSRTELQAALSPFMDRYGEYLDAAVIGRLGLEPRSAIEDRLLRECVFAFLAGSQVGFERFFFDWYGGSAAEKRAMASPEAAKYRDAQAQSLRYSLAQYQPRASANLDHAYFQQDGPCTLLIDEIEALWSMIADHDDWGPFERKVADIRTMADALMG